MYSMTEERGILFCGSGVLRIVIPHQDLVRLGSSIQSIVRLFKPSIFDGDEVVGNGRCPANPTLALAWLYLRESR